MLEVLFRKFDRIHLGLGSINLRFIQSFLGLILPSLQLYLSTNNVESFWRLFKNSVASTHIHISAERMDLYLAEFAFRSNHRHMRNAMFDLLIAAL
jgi:hypothetical protein